MHMHTLKIAVLEAGGRFDLSRLHQGAERSAAPPAAAAAASGAGTAGAQPPAVGADHDIDPSRHVVHHQLPRRGGMTEFEDLVGEVASTPLDRSVPLWEVHVVEGLPEGRVGVVGKIHHAVADGGAPTRSWATSATSSVPAARRPRSIRSRVPGRVGQLWLALRRRRSAAPDASADPRPDGGGTRSSGAPQAGAPTSAPRCRCSTPPAHRSTPRSPRGAASPRRASRSTTSNGSPSAHGVTLNDVVLALVSQALRLWLTDHDCLPRGSSSAGVPVGTDRGDGPPRLRGNRVSTLFTTLATHVDDPVAAPADLQGRPGVQAGPAGARASTCCVTGCSSLLRRRSARCSTPTPATAPPRATGRRST